MKLATFTILPILTLPGLASAQGVERTVHYSATDDSLGLWMAPFAQFPDDPAIEFHSKIVTSAVLDMSMQVEVTNTTAVPSTEKLTWKWDFGAADEAGNWGPIDPSTWTMEMSVTLQPGQTTLLADALHQQGGQTMSYGDWFWDEDLKGDGTIPYRAFARALQFEFSNSGWTWTVQQNLSDKAVTMDVPYRLLPTPGVHSSCPGLPNSTGSPSDLTLHGVPSKTAQVEGQSLFVARTESLPPGEPAMLLASTTRRSVPFSNGILCVGGSIVRLGLGVVDGSGVVEHGITLDAFAPADVVCFQTWHRDGAASNLSDLEAVEIRQ